MRAYLVLIAGLALPGCASTGGGCGFLPLITYSREQQRQAADELRLLPKSSQLSVMIIDYGKTRDAIRAAQ